MSKYRIMVQGEDGAIWCEANNKSYEWCEERGGELCQKYENANWFIEIEEPIYGYESDYE